MEVVCIDGAFASHEMPMAPNGFTPKLTRWPMKHKCAHIMQLLGSAQQCLAQELVGASFLPTWPAGSTLLTYNQRGPQHPPLDCLIVMVVSNEIFGR